MTFIENLKNLMEARKISKYKISKELDIPESTIRSWEKGTLPAIDKVIKIAQYFAVSTDYILGIDADSFDQELIKAYHAAHPGTQECVRKLLDLPEL